MQPVIKKPTNHSITLLHALRHIRSLCGIEISMPFRRGPLPIDCLRHSGKLNGVVLSAPKASIVHCVTLLAIFVVDHGAIKKLAQCSNKYRSGQEEIEWYGQGCANSADFVPLAFCSVGDGGNVQNKKNRPEACFDTLEYKIDRRLKPPTSEQDHSHDLENERRSSHYNHDDWSWLTNQVNMSPVLVLD